MISHLVADLRPRRSAWINDPQFADEPPTCRHGATFGFDGAEGCPTCDAEAEAEVLAGIGLGDEPDEGGF
jgi:hypothetical protein